MLILACTVSEQKGDNASLITPKAQRDETVKGMEEWL
ncbi:hypothetical protein BN2127_JRS1_04984 [Bacillus cereus]|nr:hypothetical protein BN2127_JRS1_04984 [Bacillus cereus]